jgi:uncharacterized protein (DUF488 family)
VKRTTIVRRSGWLRKARLYTIGFTKTTAEHFFGRLRDAGVTTLIDTRLNRAGQLAGFAKMPDLEYLLTRLTGARYRYEPLLAPSAELRRAYRDEGLPWKEYVQRYTRLLIERDARSRIPLAELKEGCLLCSEASSDRCHRRVAAEYLSAALREELEIIHL